jgi:hypothetical protein
MDEDDSRTAVHSLTASKEFCIDTIEMAQIADEGKPAKVVLYIQKWLNQINAADVVAN